MAKPATDSPGIFVVSDSSGFVGAFSSAAAARAAVCAYSCIPFILYRFPLADGPCDRVWAVLFRGADAVAFVSNNRAEAERVKGLYEHVGLAYDDPIDYWEQPFGVVVPSAIARLQPQQSARDAFAGPEEQAQLMAENEARSQRFLKAAESSDDGPIARFLRETEPITILDCIVPACRSPDAPNTTATLATPDATAMPVSASDATSAITPDATTVSASDGLAGEESGGA